MSNTTHPLAARMIAAQLIIGPATQPDANKAIAIERLAKLLCSPEAHLELLNAGAFADLQCASARCAA